MVNPNFWQGPEVFGSYHPPASLQELHKLLLFCTPVQEHQELQPFLHFSGTSRPLSGDSSLHLVAYAETPGAPSLQTLFMDKWRSQPPPPLRELNELDI